MDITPQIAYLILALIQTFAFIIQALAFIVLTSLLVYYTKKYMKQTQRMADIMKEEFEVKVKPVIEWRSLIKEIKPEPPIAKYLIYISNLGNSRIILEAIAIKYWYGLHEFVSKSV